MKNIIRNFLLLFLLKLSICNAQNVEIKGTIKSVGSQPIQSALVRLAILNKDTSTVSFSITNKFGEYKISSNKIKDTMLLITQCLGYRKHFFILYPRNNTILNNIDFTLQEKEIILNEVVVNKTVPIRLSKDTTTYKVKEFLNGTEKNVEDVLKRLPGIQIDEGGDITFKGKKIDKITIEGEDFFSKNYKLISKNMPSFALDKVEAVENYNENVLLKGIIKSDKTILNLSISEAVKSTTFGNIQGSVGVTERYEVQNTIFNLSKKMKIGGITNFNNVRFDPVSEAQYTVQAKDNIDFKDLESNSANFRVVENIPNSSIDRSRYSENNAKLVAINITKKIAESIKTRFWIYGFDDKLVQSVSNSSTYFLKDSTFEIYDNLLIQKKPSFFKSLFEIEKIFKKNLQLKFQIGNELNKPKSNIDNENSIFGLKQLIKADYNESNYYSTNTLEVTKKLADNKAIVTYLSHNYSNSSNEYYVLSPQYNFLRSSQDLPDGINQKISFYEKNTFLKIKYVEHNNNRFTQLLIGYSIINNDINLSANLFKKNNELLSLSNSFGDLGKYKKLSFYSEINNVWELEKWSFLINASYHLGKVESVFTAKNNEFSFANKSIGIKFKPEEGHSLSLIQTQIYIIPNISDLVMGYYLINQRNIQTGSGIFNIVRSDVTIFNYSLIDMVRQMSFINNFNFISSKSPYIANFAINQNLNFSNLLVENDDIHNNVFNLNSKFDKYIHKIQSRFKVGFEWSGNQTYYKVENSDLRRSSQNLYSFEGSFSTGFNFPINIEMGIIKRNTKFKLKDTDFDYNKAINTSIFANIRINKSSKIIGNIKLDYNEFEINNVKSNTFFTDLWLSFKPQKGKLSYEIIGKNIFNTKSFSNLFFNSFYSTTSTYNLSERIIQFKVEYRFGIKQ